MNRIPEPDSPPSRTGRVSLAVLVLLLAALPALALAQEATGTTPAGEPSPEVPPALTPIAPPDIPRLAGEATAALGEIRAKLSPETSVLEIEEKLPSLFESLAALRENPEYQPLEDLSPRGLENLRLLWGRGRSQLDDWQNRLEARSQTLEAEKEKLSGLRKVWELTRDSPPEGGLPEALTDQITAVLGAATELEAQLRDRLELVLTLQGRVSQEKIATTETLGQIDAALVEASGRLFSQDSATLWGAFTEPREGPGLGAQLADTWTKSYDNLARYLSSDRDRGLAHLAVFVGMVLVLAALRRRSRRWKMEGDSLENAAHILSRPISGAFLMALLMVRWFHPQAPPVFFEMLRLAIPIAIIRLLPRLVYGNLRVPLFGLTGLFILDELRSFTVGLELLHRLQLFAVAVLGFTGVVWLLRPAGPLAGRTGRWWRATIFMFRVALIPLGGSIVANLLGASRLAELLASSTLTSAYLAVALMAIVLVLDGAVTVMLRTQTAGSLRMVRLHTDLLRRRGKGIVHLAAVILWGDRTLEMFHLRGPILGGLMEFLDRDWMIGAAQISLGDILAFILTIWVAVLLSRFIRFILDEDILPRVHLPRGVSGMISTMVNYGILTLGFFVAVAAAGFELSRLTIIFGALGVGIGFGLQGLVNNFVSGLILMFERPIQVGDTIQMGTLLGRVGRIGARSSTVRTFDGSEVIVPNGNLIANEVINWTLSDRLRRIDVKVGVAYGSTPEQVLELLVETAKKQDGVLGNPEPFALFQGFGESSLDFLLRFWTPDTTFWMEVNSAVTVAVHNALKEAGIEIPFPQRDLHLRSVDTSAKDALDAGKGKGKAGD